MNSLISVHTISTKIKNQDYIESVSNKTLGFEGFILADGLGSHFLSEQGSYFCVESLKQILTKLNSLDDLNFINHFKKVHEELKDNFQDDEDLRNIEDKTKVFGTTLICVLEFKEKYQIAYLGNGSIWHIRGNFTHFSPQRYLPWSALNYLNPHTIEENGKEALYKFIALESEDLQLEPTIIEISKDLNLYGDILIVSTDGLYSNDHISIAKDREGGIWLGGEIKLEKLYNYLKIYLKSENLDFKKLEDEISKFKIEIVENNLIDDDTTFGISISNTTIKYHRALNEVNNSQ